VKQEQRDTPRHLGKELLQDLADKLAKQAQDSLGVSEAKAKSFAEEAAAALADDWGGQNIYIPMDQVGRRSQRNTQLYREFRGDNAPELAQRYGLSVQCVYRIIKAMRAAYAPRQHSLLEVAND
jgi:Mor family transcriptional regulator